MPKLTKTKCKALTKPRYHGDGAGLYLRRQKPETARRAWQRMRTIMQSAVARAHTDHNPAGEVIDGALPAMPRVKAHLRALPYTDVPMAMAIIDESRASLAALLPALPVPHGGAITITNGRSPLRLDCEVGPGCGAVQIPF